MDTTIPGARRVERLSQDVTLILGDSQEVLPHIANVDIVITDPPYSANTHGNAKSNKGAGHGRSFITFTHLENEQFLRVVRDCLSVSAGWVVMTCDYKHAALIFPDEHFVRLGAWVKPNPMPQISADRPGQGFETVAILHSGRRKKAWNRGGCSAVWTVPVMSGAEVPTQKPLRLISSFVADFTRPGELIADPFMGSGTTGVAAIAGGRRFVGIEAKEEHFEVSLRRIEAELRVGRMDFGVVVPPSPVAAPMPLSLFGGDEG